MPACRVGRWNWHRFRSCSRRNPLKDTTKAEAQRATAQFGKLPLSFEANQGQTDTRVRFLSRGQGYSLFLTSNSAVLALAPHGDLKQAPLSVSMELLGASRDAQVTGTDKLPGIVNYFLGNNPAKWHHDLPTFAKVRYASIYPGVDAVFYGNQRQLEYDFVVAPGADPTQIALRMTGVQPKLDADGNVQLTEGEANLVLHRPVVYQGDGDNRKTIQSSYTVAGKEIRFKLGSYDHSRPLVIDPKFVFMTYLGGTGNDYAGSTATYIDYVSPNGDSGLNPSNAVAIDPAGNVYIAGKTQSTDFPTKNPYQSTLNTPEDLQYDFYQPTGFISKLDPTGETLLYSTYLGGSTYDEGVASIAVDASGDAYVVGATQSDDFPTTPGAFQTSGPRSAVANTYSFVTKLNASGSKLVYSTYLGSDYDTNSAFSVAIDSAGQAYVAGTLQSGGFPTTPNAIQSSAQVCCQSQAFVTVLNAGGSGLEYSTLIGNPNETPTGTYYTHGLAVAVDSSANFYVTGSTNDPALPATTGVFQPTLGPSAANTVEGFVAKFGPVNSSGATLTYLTYLHATGTDQQDYPEAITADAEGNAYVAGYTQSPTFPTTTGAYESASNCAVNGATELTCGFVTKLNPTGTALVWSSLLGTSNYQWISGIAVDKLGYVYVTGEAGDNFSCCAVNALQTIPGDDFGFIAKFDPTGSTLVFSSPVGNSGDGNSSETWTSGVAVDPLGDIYLAGATSGSQLPVTPNAFQATFKGGDRISAAGGQSAGFDAFVTRIHVETPDLTIAKTHTGNFTLGETGAVYTITVTNSGDGPTNGSSGAVTVTEAVPTGLTLESMSGSGWTCTTLPTCARSDVLAAAASYPAISVTVNVASDAPSTVVNTATVAGGGEYNTGNNSASDTAKIYTDTTTTLAASTTSVVYPQTVTYTATVKPTLGTGTPTGTVTFNDGTTALGTGTLNGSGVATFTNTPAAGSHAITATYGGDTGNATSISAVVTVTSVYASTTALAATPNPAAYGAQVTFTATVSNGASTAATGTVTFKDGTTALGTGTLSAAGVATYSTSSLAVAAHSITAVYGGDTGDGSSTSPSVSVSVTADATATTLKTSATSIAFGNSITLTATVTSTSGTVLPTGSVTFLDGATTLGTGTLNASGVATYSATSLTIGAHSFTAAYAAGTDDTSSTSAAVSATVTTIPGTTALMLSAGSAAVGTSVTFTATVTPGSGTGTPTGTIEFLDGTTMLGSVTLLDGKATYSIATLAVGAHSITAQYGGDTDDSAGTSTASALTITALTPTVVLTVSPATAVVGSSISLTAAVTGTSGTPTGTVMFLDGTTVLNTATLASGNASYSTASLAAGVHSIAASYSGDATFAPLTTAAQTVTIRAVAPSITLTADKTSLVIIRGQSGSTTITATPVGGYTGSFTLSCGTLPQYASCAFSTTTITITSTSPATSTLTISTTATQAKLEAPPLWPNALRTFAALLLPVFFFARKRRGAKSGLWIVLPVLLLCGLAAGALTGCGGAGAPATTPPGDYPITIDATGGTTGSLNLQITVQ